MCVSKICAITTSQHLSSHKHMTPTGPAGVNGGQPLVLYNQALSTVVISPLDNFMVGAQTVSDQVGGWAGVWCVALYTVRCRCRCLLLTRALPACSPPQFPGCLSCGLNGKILQVPVNFTFATVLVAGHGINSTMYNWGGSLLQRHGKGRTSLGADRAIMQLGYWTGESKQDSLALVWCYVCMTHPNVKPWAHIVTWLRGAQTMGRTTTTM